MDNHDFAMEKRLRELNPLLHKQFTDAVFALQNILSNYKLIFPAYTDHSELHALNVIEFCNKIIGDEIKYLNEDEIYCLLMGCYFHDTGMGISQKDFEQFSKEIDFGNYFDTHAKDDYPRIVRDFHNEYSGRFIIKYADLFEIPSDNHLRAIIQIARGHRKTNLKDENEYPIDLRVDNGNTICLPYLAAIIRLADEIDISAARNSRLLYDIPTVVVNHDSIEFLKHEAVREMLIEKDKFVVLYKTEFKEVEDELKVLFSKMQKTLDECIDATNERTKYYIYQKEITCKKID